MRRQRQPLERPPPPVGNANSARQALPLAAEGEYRWGEPGEVIELYVEEHALRGYLTRRSERRLAGSTPLTFVFTQASATGGALRFTTRQIHGDWYSFEGRIVRDPAARPHQSGCYLLQGILTTHALGSGQVEDSRRDQARQVSLKLEAGRQAD